MALNDISDGIASESNELAEASDVTLVLEQDKLPLAGGETNFSYTQRLDWALFGGEDFQLIGTMAKEHFQDAAEKLKKKTRSS